MSDLPDGIPSHHRAFPRSSGCARTATCLARTWKRPAAPIGRASASDEVCRSWSSIGHGPWAMVKAKLWSHDSNDMIHIDTYLYVYIYWYIYIYIDIYIYILTYWIDLEYGYDMWYVLICDMMWYLMKWCDMRLYNVIQNGMI